MITKTNPITDINAYERSGQLICGLAGSSGEPLKSPVPEDLLYFDIETTGLSPKDSCIYLIGCMYGTADGPVLTQFFSESPDEEQLLIEALNGLLLTHPVLVHYNGSSFDVPFVRSRAEALGITLSPIREEIDIYKLLKPCKSLLGLKSMRMKAMEKYLGIDREDIYDGGELIWLYIKYVARRKYDRLCHSGDNADPVSSCPNPPSCSKIETEFSDDTGLRLLGSAGCEELLGILLLHNCEDVLNLPAVAELLALNVFLSGGFDIQSVRLYSAAGQADLSSVPAESGCAPSLTFTLGNLDPAVIGILARIFKSLSPAAGSGFIAFRATPCGRPETTIRLRLTGKDSAELTLDASFAELKLFFPDYRNYYYLVNEDYAIHKSIGQLMDKSLCVKCTAANCYTRKSGVFLPVFDKKGGALADKVYLYRQNAPDRSNFVCVDDLINDPAIAKLYVIQILNSVTLFDL